MSFALLGEQPYIGQHINHLALGQVAGPGMHGTEDDPVFDRAQQLFVGFQEGPKQMKVGGGNSERCSGGAVSPAGLAVAGCAVVLIQRFASVQVGGKILGGNKEGA